MVAIFSVLVMSGTPVHAVPVAISEVLQVFGSFQNPPELRLRSVSQDSSPLASGVKGPLTTNGSNDVPDTLTDDTPARGAAGSLLSGIAINPHEQQLRIDTIAEGDVQGTICDCGEILIVGGFPKWPLLFLAAIPFFFIHHDDHHETTPTPTPTPIPTPPPPNVQTPEPSTVLLLGTGLLALIGGLRRRHNSKSVVEIQSQASGINRS